MRKKERGWVSLELKLNVLILVVILVLAGGLTLTAYQVNASRVDRYYKQTTANMANVVAGFVDAQWMEDFLSFITSDEYQTLRTEAIEAGDEGRIRTCLEEKGWYEGFEQMRHVLDEYRTRFGAEYIYTVMLIGGDGFTIIDPDEDLFYIGKSIPVPPEFANIRAGERVEPTVSVTEYGWLCSAYDNIVSEDNRVVAQVGVDINMDDVMHERQQFLIQMLAFGLVLLLASSVAEILLVRRIATKPLAMLTRATGDFTSGEKAYTKENVIDLPIHSKDEIGDLYDEVRTMQNQIVEYLFNLKRVTAEKERIGAELDIASEIQSGMLPSLFPPFPGRKEFDIYATMTPAKEVGGDFFDFFLIDDDHLGLVIADVSGKGVPAALVMMASKILASNFSMMDKTSPARILEQVNNAIDKNNPAEMFVTCWLGIFEISTGRLKAANAGHEYPCIRRPETGYELYKDRHGLVLGAMPGARYREYELTLAPGDSLFVYTDGVPEATNAQEVLFGTDRMLEALNSSEEDDPAQVLARVHEAVNNFVLDAPQFDDLTMLGMRYNGCDGRHDDKQA